MIKKVLLINPSNTLAKSSVRRLAPPLGLLYLASALKKNGFIVEIIDSTCDGYNNILEEDSEYITYGLSDKQIKRRIEYSDPDLVGISSMFSSTQERAFHHCDIVKEVTNVPLVVGGIHPSLEPAKTVLHHSIDYVIEGEGEFRLVMLIDSLNTGKTEFSFDGIAYKNIDGKVVYNPMTTRIQNLDSIPFPDLGVVNFEEYVKIGIPYAPFSRGKRPCEILTSRGCPFHCIFCSMVNHWGRKFRKRTVDNIIEEIHFLIDNYQIDEVQFVDDNMTIDRQRTMELFERYKKEVKLPWCTPHGLMIKTLDEKMIKLMAESGAYQVTVAIESGSERVLKEIIHKPIPSKLEVKRIVDLFHQYGVQVHGLFVIGFPGEKKKEIIETLEYPFDIGFESISYFTANPMPGSDLYTMCKEKGYLKQNAQKDFKAAEIIIPKSSSDYFMDPNELTKLIEKYTKKYNTYSKEKFSYQWEEKFKVFLEKHPEQKEKLLGRVT
jgi:radical SAM superfamily enzyme YgiQ (UPF0313 family)